MTQAGGWRQMTANRESSTIVRALQVRGLFTEKNVRLKTSQVARHLNIPWSSAKYQLEIASLEIPLHQDADKYWQILEPDDKSQISCD